MLFKKFHDFAGPAKFEFKDPDTGHLYNATTRPELVKQILFYREQNQLPQIEALNLVLENYWCAQKINAGNCGSYKLERSFMGYVKGGMALLKNMAFKSYVTQEEADRRASICLTCPHNVVENSPRFQTWTNSIAKKAIGERRSIHHTQLGVCDCCTCPLAAKVWFGEKITLSEDERSCVIQSCWQK